VRVSRCLEHYAAVLFNAAACYRALPYLQVYLSVLFLKSDSQRIREKGKQSWHPLQWHMPAIISSGS